MPVFNNVAGKRPIFQYLAVFSALLSTTCSGMHYGWPSPILPQLLANDSYIPMSNSDGSWVVVALPMGSFLGTASSAIVTNIFGRKPVILFTSIPFFTSWIVLASAGSVPELIIGRLLAGFSDGLTFCTVPMYIGEIANHNVRGFLGSAPSVSFYCGILGMNVIGSYCSIPTTALVACLVPLSLLLTFVWMPESPYYLIMKGHLDHARRNLKLLKGMDDVEEELNRLIKASEKQTKSRYWDLFTVKSNRRALFIILGIRGSQRTSGMMSIIFYAQIIFADIGNNISPKTSSLIVFVIQVVFSAISASIVDKTGRRPLLITSLTGCSLSILTAASYFCIQKNSDIDTSGYTYVPAAALMFYVILFAIGLQAIPILLVGEMFPTNVKAFAVSLCDMYFVTLTIIVTKFFQITKDAFGLHVPFFVFGLFCGLGAMFVIYYVPETKGKTLEQIQFELEEITRRERE